MLENEILPIYKARVLAPDALLKNHKFSDDPLRNGTIAMLDWGRGLLHSSFIRVDVVILSVKEPRPSQSIANVPY